jgi:hypothetical protein
MDDVDRYPAALYCAICPLKDKCGGLHCKASPFGCEEFCCGKPSGCTTVCPANPQYLEQFSEVGGFDLHTIPSIPGPRIQVSQRVIPLIYHGSKREGRFAGRTVALRLADLIDFPRKSSRYFSRSALCDAFKIDDQSCIVLTGVDHDPSIERIWALGSDRVRVFREIADLGIACATTPNFSMVLDVPRADNLHAMQRIGIVCSEMSEAGLPAALHVNGRTDQDFVRWGELLRRWSHVNAISYEFITGGGLAGRIAKHTSWLNRLREHAGRPLICIVRGNPACLDLLESGYTLIYIETTSFVKTINRQAPVRLGNSKLRWSTNRRSSGLDVSEALEANSAEVRGTLLARYPRLAD